MDVVVLLISQHGVMVKEVCVQCTATCPAQEALGITEGR